MTVEIIIDPNVRTTGNRTYAGFEDVRGGFVDDLSPGDAVTVVEEESDVVGEAIIDQVNHHNHLIYLQVEWSSLRPRPQVRPFSLRAMSPLVRSSITGSYAQALDRVTGFTSSSVAVDSSLATAG